MRSVHLLLTAVMLGGCTYSLRPPIDQAPLPVPVAEPAAPAEPKPFVSPYLYTETSDLCTAYQDPMVDSRVRAGIEVELVTRGEKFCNGTNIGMASLIKMGRQRYDRTEAAPSGSNCGRYATGALAQQAFLAAGGPEKDPEILDRDGDGLACGWGDELKWIATAQPE